MHRGRNEGARHLRGGVLLAALLTGSPGCGRVEPPAPRPDVLFLSVDTLRRDHLGCYGYPRATSPHLDALARRGAIFGDMTSTCSWTLPSHATMLTGMYPPFHGLQDDGVKLPSYVPTLAEAFRGRGYHTLAVVSHVYVSSAFGLERGFDAFDDSLIEEGATNPTAAQVVDRFLERLREAPERPFFAFLHFFDPHWDYTPPPPFPSPFTRSSYDGPVDGTFASIQEYVAGSEALPREDLRELVARYDAEIAYLDAEIGRLLASLREGGRLDSTVVVFTGDHGEEFQEHGLLGHGYSLFGEEIDVPLILAGHPAFPPGTRRTDPASTIDLAPTLAELAGADGFADRGGTSLVGGPAAATRLRFAESIRFGLEMRSVRRDRYKLVHYLSGDRRYYFDLGRDPREQRPLAGDPTRGALARALDEYAARADAGWHLKILDVTPRPLRGRGVIRTSGRIVAPRRYFSQNIPGRAAAFRVFDLDPTGSILTFDVAVRNHLGEIAFATDPEDAPVTFQIEVDGPVEGAGVFLGREERIPGGEPITLSPSDPRVTGYPGDYASAAPGIYIRAVRPVAAPRARLSQEALERLRALGYVDSRAGGGD